MKLPLNRRTGFSLVELMVVISIIAILIALSMAGVMSVRKAQQVRSTESIVEKVQLAVDNQVKAITAQAQKDIQYASSADAQALINYMGGDTDAAQALLVYCRIKASFPQTFTELQGLSTTTPPGTTTAVPYFTVGNNTGKAYFFIKSPFLKYTNLSATSPLLTDLTPAQQSAALLYAAVSDSGAGGSTFAEEATNSAHFDFLVPGGGGATVHVYMDAWKQPIGFCRFGTNSELTAAPYINPNAATDPLTGRRLEDPYDPSGKLYEWKAKGIPHGGAGAAESTIFVQNGDPANATTFNATNRRPVVFSCGFNQVYESLNPTSDDVLSYRLTQLGQRGAKR